MAHIDVIGDLGWPRPQKSSTPGPLFEYLAAHLCDSRNRRRWWSCGPHRLKEVGRVPSCPVNDPAGAIGRLLSDVLNIRESLRDRRGGACTAIGKLPLTTVEADVCSRADLVNLNPDDKALKAFLCGSPPNEALWTKYAPNLLSYSLLTAIHGGEDELRAVRACVNRICTFFFPDSVTSRESPGERSYFHPELRYSDSESSTSEAVATIWRTAWSARNSVPKSRLAIVRTSAGARFQQTTPDGRSLTRSGIATIDALRAGVEVIYVHPTAEHRSIAQGSAASGTDAESSLRHFASHVEREDDSDVLFTRLKAIEMEPGGGESSGLVVLGRFPTAKIQMGPGAMSEQFAFITPLARYVAHARCSGDSPLHGNISTRVLLIRRPSPVGFGGPRASDREMATFDSWFNQYVAPWIPRLSGSLAPSTATAVCQ
jgi:hypothetical protein